jgi:cell division transport system permease protein
MRDLGPPRFPQRTLGQRVLAWLEQHAAAAGHARRRLTNARWATPLSAAAIGLALVLPALLALAWENSPAVAQGFESARDIAVYLHVPMADGDARRLTARIAARGDVASARYISPDDGLVDFRQWSGLGSAVDALGRNPLPGAILIRPRADTADPESVDRLAGQLRALPDVAQVQLNSAWIRRYATLVATLTRIAQALALLWCGTVLLIIGNTIRLQIDAESAELDVLTLVGATNAWLRRPFLYAGSGYGLCGGIVACGVLVLLVAGLQGPIAAVAATYGSDYRLHFPSVRLMGALLLGGTGLGWLAAWGATTRHRRARGPWDLDRG